VTGIRSFTTSAANGSAAWTVARAALLGAATGGRTTAPLASLAWAPPRIGPAPLPAALRRLTGRNGRVLATLALAGELTGDKLPQTPSRLAPPGLAGRLAFGAVGGLALAMRRTGRTTQEAAGTAEGVAAMAVGLASAAAGAYAGSRWRASAPFASDLPAALLEDAVVATLALVATRT
jgi:uncharacterized membrane protein